jgi:uncharacterized protein (TIGR03118 family)
MNSWHRRRLAPALLLAAGLALTGCGGGDDHHDHEDFQVTALVVDQASGNPYTAMHTDTHLINPWGIAFNPQGFVWVANAETGSSTLYDGRGIPQSLVVSIPSGSRRSGGPTGIVFSGSDDFVVTGPSGTGPSRFLFVTEGGTLAAWSPDANPTAAITVFDGGAEERIYKGLALQAGPGGGMRLYATDFHNSRVDVFDAEFKPVFVAGGFGDPNLPRGYAPFGIQAFGDRLLVSFARQDDDAEDDVAGNGFGFVDLFTNDGVLVKRLITQGHLNAPWGMALAPDDFGRFGGALLVGNFGDGRINAYDPDTGRHLGELSRSNGEPIEIEGLWGIAFGNGINEQPTDTLFFAAGPGDEEHGVYGRIDVD